MGKNYNRWRYYILNSAIILGIGGSYFFSDYKALISKIYFAEENGGVLPLVYLGVVFVSILIEKVIDLVILGPKTYLALGILKMSENKDQPMEKQFEIEKEDLKLTRGNFLGAGLYLTFFVVQISAHRIELDSLSAIRILGIRFKGSPGGIINLFVVNSVRYLYSIFEIPIQLLAILCIYLLEKEPKIIYLLEELRISFVKYKTKLSEYFKINFLTEELDIKEEDIVILPMKRKVEGRYQEGYIHSYTKDQEKLIQRTLIKLVWK